MKRFNQKGQAIIFVALSFVVLGVFAGFATDFVNSFLQRLKLYRTVDAVALAAAKALRGQEALQNEARVAGCGAAAMNGVTSCGPTSPLGGDAVGCTEGPDIAICFVDREVPGGPDMRFVQVTGRTTVPTTFLRLMSFLISGDFSRLSMLASAEAGPERPVDLVFILDRSGSMNDADQVGTPKIVALKNTVDQFLSSGTFQSNDRLGMISFAHRGCGQPGLGIDVTGAVGTSCRADYPLGSSIPSIQEGVNALVAQDYTNTQEAFRSAWVQLNDAFGLPDRRQSRKVVLLITDGQPTAMRRNNTLECRRFPDTNGRGWLTGGLPEPWGSTGPDGCTFYTANPEGFSRRTLDGSDDEWIANGDALVFRTIADGYRNMQGGAMFEADAVRNLRLLDATRGQVVVYVIGIGTDDPEIGAKNRLDNNSKCFLARVANARTISDPTVLPERRNMTYVCNNSGEAGDGDPYADLRADWPVGFCLGGGAPPCADSRQMEGKVWVVDQNGDVQTQLRDIFREVAMLLKLRLTA